MVTTISLSSKLKSPMYFFLRNLSIVDICFTSSTVPKLLLDFLSEEKKISYMGCVAQVYSFVAFGGIECVLLAAMAGDRYVAICLPLRYIEIMNQKVCIILVAICWVIGLVNSLVHTIFTFRLPFCKSNEIKHFYCDIPPLLALSCADTTANELLIYTAGISVTMGPCLLILMSYIYIIKSILQIKTTSGRLKAFSTCGSHLTVVILFFGTLIYSYVYPITTTSLEHDRTSPVIYGIMTPMLNPLIYSFKNKDVHEALKKVYFK
ncbi:olfactory receptor 5V1-like [Discoglossus pictus]